MEIDENKIGYTPTGNVDEPLAPVVIYSLSFGDEELIMVYGALRTYLKVLSQQESEDLEAIGRTVKIMSQVKPRAVEASKSLALKAAGMISPSS